MLVLLLEHDWFYRSKSFSVISQGKIYIFLQVFFLLNEQAGFVWDASQILCFAMEIYIAPSYT